MTQKMTNNDPIPAEHDARHEVQPEQQYSFCRSKPRLVYTNPDSFFGRDFFDELLMEQCEQM